MNQIKGNEFADELFSKINNNFGELGGFGEEVPFDDVNYYNNQTSSFATGSLTGKCATTKINIQELKALFFSGGGVMYWASALFYNGNTMLGVGLIHPEGVNIASPSDYFLDMVDVLPRCPEGTTHVVLQTDKSRHPSSKVLKFTSTPPPALIDPYWRQDYYGIKGDGVTDDTNALKAYIYNSSGFVTLRPRVYRITDTIVLNTLYIRGFNGNGATIMLDNDTTDKEALKIVGNLPNSATADPDKTLQQYRSASFTLENLRIMSKSGENYIANNSGIFKGIGLKISKCNKPVVRSCFIYMLDKGIVVDGTNRDMIFCDNNIYSCYTSGIEFMSTCNLHQLNINNNHISYCKYNINFDNPSQIANVQIVGNDIETSRIYPTNITESDKRCIRINTSGVFYEVEIVGNTLQGHGNSDGADHIIEIVGNGEIMMSICGNHLSNCAQGIISITSATDISICGNTANNTAGSFVHLAAGTIQRVAVSGNTMYSQSKPIVSTGSTAALSHVSVTGNVGNNTPITVDGTSQDYISVVGNCLGGGTVTIGDATHKQEANNI